MLLHGAAAAADLETSWFASNATATGTVFNPLFHMCAIVCGSSWGWPSDCNDECAKVAQLPPAVQNCTTLACSVARNLNRATRPQARHTTTTALETLAT